MLGSYSVSRPEEVAVCSKGVPMGNERQNIKDVIKKRSHRIWWPNGCGENNGRKIKEINDVSEMLHFGEWWYLWIK